MKALVTGGAGFIGSHLVHHLVAAGHAVTVLDDLSTGEATAVHPDAALVIADVCDLSAVRAAIDGCDVVFHLAAHRAIARSIDDPAGTDRTNSQGTVTVLQAAAEARVPRIVNASSSSVYGEAASPPVREDAPKVPLSPYAVSKLAAEHYCRVFGDLFGLHTISLRYFNVYGPGQPSDGRYATVIPLFLDALLSGRRPVVFGDGSRARDFTYVDDVVGATLAAAAAAPETAGRAYNVAAGRPWSLVALLELLGELVGVTPDPVHEDARPGDVLRTHGDPAALEREVGYRCSVPLEEGLARTVEWFRGRRREREWSRPAGRPGERPGTGRR
ncbi:MAG: NAD-dependent epimerase/dehydratase family protein [Actinomycetota bacterium]|nr:NAD-dependent epimerase/dehydratase family protein [Actinomycetota bacterium]